MMAGVAEQFVAPVFCSNEVGVLHWALIVLGGTHLRGFRRWALGVRFAEPQSDYVSIYTTY